MYLNSLVPECSLTENEDFDRKFLLGPILFKFLSVPFQLAAYLTDLYYVQARHNNLKY